jgi:hypothetical protein
MEDRLNLQNISAPLSLMKAFLIMAISGQEVPFKRHQDYMKLPPPAVFKIFFLACLSHFNNFRYLLEKISFPGPEPD